VCPGISRATLVFDVREGEIEGTDVRGRKLAVIIDTPKVMTEGNWRLGMFIDEDATDEQMEKLSAVFGGQMGGPTAGLAPLVGEVLGVERRSRSLKTASATASVSGTRSTSRWKTSSPSASRPDSPCASTACSILLHRTSRWRRRSGRTSTPSASSTKGSRGCRRPSARGPPERLSASAYGHAPGSGGLTPAFAAARAPGSGSSHFSSPSQQSAGSMVPMDEMSP
jgi:uncharacterized protein DUF1326